MSDTTEDHRALERKLAVILASDVAGFSTLVEADEETTITHLAKVSAVISGLVTKARGRVFNTAGDAILAEFDSAVNAVRCAIDVQDAVRGLNESLPSEKWLRFRIGIAIGDVIVAKNGDLLGDGVNIAARLQTIASPGGICISQDVRGLVAKKISLDFRDLGSQALKNMSEPVRAYEVLLDGEKGAQAPAIATMKPAPRFQQRWAAIAIAGLAVAVTGVWIAAKRRPPVIAAVEPAKVEIAKAEPAKVEPVKAEPVAPKAAEPVDPSVRKFDPDKVPLVPDAVRARLIAGYAQAGDHKALAISNEGDSHGIAVNEPSPEAASRKALEDCATKARRRCFIYSVGNRVVWEAVPLSLPFSSDVRIQPTTKRFDPAELALFHSGQKARIERDYPTTPGQKAIAIGNQGDSGWVAMATGDTPAEAARRGLEFCAFRTGGPCIVYAIGDYLTVEIPTTHKPVGVFTFAGDRAMPAGERDRLRVGYSGDDWRAISRGRNGTWHVVSSRATEAAAVADVLKACNAVDRDCKVYAIGSFLVKEK